MKLTLNVNARPEQVDVMPDTPLLYALRNDLNLNGPKFGCGLAQCGACTVHIDGAAVRSCVTPASAAAGREITTIEALASGPKPHPLLAAFIAEQAGQCGYCLNGMVMGAAALLRQNPRPDNAEIRAALDGNLCRCGSHMRILRAVRRAADAMQKDLA
jgi:nicotinate dehydrogenase subunit A